MFPKNTLNNNKTSPMIFLIFIFTIFTHRGSSTEQTFADCMTLVDFERVHLSQILPAMAPKIFRVPALLTHSIIIHGRETHNSKAPNDRIMFRSLKE